MAKKAKSQGLFSWRNVRNTLLYGPGGAVVAHKLHKTHEKERKAERAFKHVQEKGSKASKKDKKLYNKYVKEYNKQEAERHKIGMRQARLGEKMLKKYGGEKFQQFDALNRRQDKLLSTLAEQGREIGKVPDITKSRLYKQAVQRQLSSQADIRNNPLYQAAQQGLLGPQADIRNNPLYQQAAAALTGPGSDVENNPLYQQAAAALTGPGSDIENNPLYRQAASALMGPGSNIENNPLYAAGKQSVLDLLSSSPEAYERFKAPVMREFSEQIVPDIANRFSLYGGQRGSSFQNALGNAATALGTNLGSLRAQLQQEGRQQAFNYAQQPFQNMLAVNEQLSQLAQQPLANRFAKSQQLSQLAQQPLANRFAKSQQLSQLAQQPFANLLARNEQASQLAQQSFANDISRAQLGLGLAQAPIENALGRNAQALQSGQLALGTNPYVNIYRPPTIPGAIQSGGFAIPAPNNPTGFVQAPQRSPSLWSQLLGAAAPAAGTAIGGAIGGPIGGLIGGGIGNTFGNMMNRPSAAQGAYQQLQAAPAGRGAAFLQNNPIPQRAPFQPMQIGPSTGFRPGLVDYNRSFIP